MSDSISNLDPDVRKKKAQMKSKMAKHEIRQVVLLDTCAELWGISLSENLY